MGDAPRAARRFAFGLALVVALALALRLWALERCGIDHFDEGVYAFSAASIAEPHSYPALYPGQEQFSPPAYFTAAGLLARASGLGVERALFALNALLGAATVALLGLVGRRWFGTAAGLAAAALLACSEYHIALCRSALTDVAFALAHLGAWFVLVEALRSERWSRAVLAGALVALAWNIKYHGWLAVVAAAFAFTPILVTRVRRREHWRRPLTLGVVAALVAALGYLPWALHVNSLPGGYAALAEYQSTMLRGAWLENLSRQASQQMFFEGPFSAASLPLALAGAAWCARARRRSLLVVAALALAAIGVALGAAAGIVGLALFACATLARPALRLEWPALALLAALALWSALTPFYHPYARLLLPLLLALMLASGAGLAALFDESGKQSQALAPWPALLAAAVAALTVFAARLRDDPSDPWREAHGVERAAERVAQALPARARVLVLGDPALAWYLRRAGLREVDVVPGPQALEVLEREAREAFVACGLYPRLTGAEQRLIEAAGARLALHGEADVQVKDLRLLDDFRVRQALRMRRVPTDDFQVRVYRYGAASDPLTR